MFDTQFSSLQLFSNLTTTRTWGKIAYHLLKAEESGEWQNEANTFTDWVSAVATTLKLQESNLWRYRSSAKYALELHQLTLNQLPEEEIVSKLNQANPENLELLSKIYRAAPEALFKEMATQVLAGKMPRPKIRQAWQAFRPALKGQTAQGIGKTIPMVNAKDPEQFTSIMEGIAHSALIDNGGKWLNVAKPYAYEYFIDVAPKDKSGSCRFVFDAVSAIQENENAQLIFHIIEFSTGFIPGQLDEKSQYGHYFWLASTNQNITTELPNWVGLLQISNNEITVVRKASPCKSDPALLAETSNALLVRKIKR